MLIRVFLGGGLRSVKIISLILTGVNSLGGAKWESRKQTPDLLQAEHG